MADFRKDTVQATVVPSQARGCQDVCVDALMPGERGRAWERHLSDLVLPMRIRIPDSNLPRFRGRIRRQWLGDLALVDCRADAFSGRRSKTPGEEPVEGFVVIVLSVAGCEVVTAGRKHYRMVPGSGVALREDADFEFDVMGAYRKRLLMVPTHALSEAGTAALGAGVVPLPQAGATVALLNSYLESLDAMLPALSSHGVEAARNATIELVNGAIQGGGERDDLAADRYSPALKVAMDRWIEQHLVDPWLSPEALAAAHSISTRTVHRMFSSSGETFGETVRGRRLAAARQDLMTSDLAVAAIAARWGFADASHFTRTFRGAYGQTPSQCRAERLP